MSDRLSGLDANQIIRRSGADLTSGNQVLPDGGLGVVNLGGSLVPEKYDEIVLTYVAAGNGAGEIETATYLLDSQQVAVLTLTYDGSDRLSTVVRS